jgi:hypothetical protein
LNKVELFYINYTENIGFDFKRDEIVYKYIVKELKLTEEFEKELQQIVWTIPLNQYKVLKYNDKYLYVSRRI